MNLHSLNNVSEARRSRKRLGRGQRSGTGKTAGRGHKGQKARAGYSRKAVFEGGQMPLVRRLPKRGFKPLAKRSLAVVNVGELERFEPGTRVTVDVLRAAGLVKGSWDGVKLLGQGKLDRSLTVAAHAFSAAARGCIEAAGGTCEIVR